MSRILSVLSFAVMAGLTSAQAEELDWITSGWPAEVASHGWTRQSVIRDKAASPLNLEVAWPADETGVTGAPADPRSVDAQMRIRSCYQAAQYRVSDHLDDGTFGSIDGVAALGAMIDRHYARNRRWSQFAACSGASR